jgi:hypothetical protein
MTSATPTRRVLVPLDVNTPSIRSVAPSPGAKAGSPEKSQNMGEGISIQAFEHTLPGAVHKEGRVDGAKRSFSPITSVSTFSKRQKTGTAVGKGSGVAFNIQSNRSTFGLAQALSVFEHVGVDAQSFPYEVSAKCSTPSTRHAFPLFRCFTIGNPQNFPTLAPDYMLIRPK